MEDTPPEIDAPPRLVEALQGMDAAADVDQATDTRVLAAIREHYAAGRRRRWWWRVGAPATAAAAVLVAFLLDAGREPDVPVTDRAAAQRAREDFDGNGRVDILDAFRLDLALARGTDPSSAWDLNADGSVDAADVAEVARAAVRLGSR